MMMADGTAKLTDFGIAKGLETSKLTATNCAVGTAAYMSPEQCRGERDLTSKSDLYSLGVLFYELLTGRLPFQADTTLDMFLAHTEGTFERPSRLVLDIPIWLDTLVCQLLEKDPAKRPYDAAMVAQSLSRVLEKVAAQRSAGADAVSGTMLDRPRAATIADESDREAARLIRAATGKHRVKRRTKRIYERTWFQATAIVTILFVVGGIVYLAIQPPSADKLFAKAQRLMTSSDPDERREAREDPIEKYLHYYPNRDDEQAKQVRSWADQVDLDQRERQLRNRMRMKMTPDGEAETAAQGAVRMEETGDLKSAADRWQKLLRFKDAEDANERAWFLLADKRLRELNSVAETEQGLRKRVDDIRHFRTQPAAQESERQVELAVRAELFGDLGLALDSWEKLKEKYQADPDARPRVLLASKKVYELKDKCRAARKHRHSA